MKCHEIYRRKLKLLMQMSWTINVRLQVGLSTTGRHFYWLLFKPSDDKKKTYGLNYKRFFLFFFRRINEIQSKMMTCMTTKERSRCQRIYFSEKYFPDYKILKDFKSQIIIAEIWILSLGKWTGSSTET